MGKQGKQGSGKWRAHQKRQHQGHQARRRGSGAADLSSAKAKSVAKPSDNMGKKSKDDDMNKKEQTERSRSPIERRGVRSPPRPRKDRPLFTDAYPFGAPRSSKSRGSRPPGERENRPRTPERRSARPRSPPGRQSRRTASPPAAYDTNVRQNQDTRFAQLSSFRPSRSRGQRETRQTASPLRRAPPGERSPRGERRGHSQRTRVDSRSPTPSSPSPAPAKTRRSPARPDPASAAVRDGAGHPEQGASDSSLGGSEADPDGRVELSPVRGMSLLEASRSCTWSHGLLIRTITQKWRPP